VAADEMNEVRERMSLRVRLVRQLGQRVTQSPETQLEYMEDMQKLLTGQARDAEVAANNLAEQAPAEAAVMERYGDALVAAKDPVTGGQDWAIVKRAMQAELPAQAVKQLETSQSMYVTKAASREAALMSWIPTAEPSQVETALNRYWDAHEQQEQACTIDLGDSGQKCDRSRLVSQAWRAVSNDADLSARARTRFEQNSALMDEPESPTGQLAARMMTVDRASGVSQTRAWDEHMGRDRTPAAAVTGPSLDMMTGHTVTGQGPDTGLDR
jgi:hypothetical protein